jgi:hypothetical protein
MDSATRFFEISFFTFLWIALQTFGVNSNGDKLVGNFNGSDVQLFGGVAMLTPVNKICWRVLAKKYFISSKNNINPDFARSLLNK